ncbi:unnamed protein product, partial [Candidula unifasciata]
CDLAHPDNKLVSGKHCYINRDENGRVWLYDTSTNGTLLNLSIKLTKGECRELRHGDEIHIVHKKVDTREDIGYMFQDMEALRAEASSDSEDSQECTQLMDVFDGTISDENVNTVTTPSPLRKRKSMEISPVVSKKIKADSHPNAAGFCTQTAGKPRTPQEPEEDAIAETLVCTICQELLHDCISLQPCMHSFCAGCYSEWMERSQECPSCRLKVTRISKNHIVNNLVEAYLKGKPDKKRLEADIKELDSKNKITRDMLYPVQKPGGDSNSGSFSESYTDSDDDADDSYTIGAAAAPAFANNFNNFNAGGLLFGIGTPFYGTAALRPAQAVCRQCRSYAGRQNTMLAGA